MGWEHAERSSSPHWTLPAPWGPRSRDASSPSAASGTFTHLHLPQIPFQTQLPLEGCMHVCSVMSDSLQPMGCSLPGSPIHEIFQARILEWVAISSSRGFSRSRDWTSLSPALADGFFTTKPPRKPTFREKAMPKGIGVSGFVEKVIPFPELSIPSFLAVNSQLYSIILFTGLCIPIDNNGGGGQKNSLTSTLPPSQIYFSQVKLDRGQKRKKEKKKNLQNSTDPAQEKGFWIMFSASKTLAGLVSTSPRQRAARAGCALSAVWLPDPTPCSLFNTFNPQTAWDLRCVIHPCAKIRRSRGPLPLWRTLIPPDSRNRDLVCTQTGLAVLAADRLDWQLRVKSQTDGSVTWVRQAGRRPTQYLPSGKALVSVVRQSSVFPGLQFHEWWNLLSGENSVFWLWEILQWQSPSTVLGEGCVICSWRELVCESGFAVCLLCDLGLVA